MLASDPPSPTFQRRQLSDMRSCSTVGGVGGGAGEGGPSTGTPPSSSYTLGAWGASSGTPPSSAYATGAAGAAPGGGGGGPRSGGAGSNVSTGDTDNQVGVGAHMVCGGAMLVTPY